MNEKLLQAGEIVNSERMPANEDVAGKPNNLSPSNTQIPETSSNLSMEMVLRRAMERSKQEYPAQRSFEQRPHQHQKTSSYSAKDIKSDLPIRSAAECKQNLQDRITACEDFCLWLRRLLHKIAFLARLYIQTKASAGLTAEQSAFDVYQYAFSLDNSIEAAGSQYLRRVFERMPDSMDQMDALAKMIAQHQNVIQDAIIRFINLKPLLDKFWLWLSEHLQLNHFDVDESNKATAISDAWKTDAV